jgi:small subunit ribosomal protein S16
VAVRIRLKRLGRRHRPFYRVSVMDSKSQRDGKSIEDLGHYDPMVRDKSQRVKLDMERVDHWISVGAKPTEKVAVLIKKVKTNKFGEIKAPPPMTPPKEPPAPEPEETAPAETEGATEETPAEEASAEASE